MTYAIRLHDFFWGKRRDRLNAYPLAEREKEATVETTAAIPLSTASWLSRTA